MTTDAIVATLREQIAERDARITELEYEVERLGTTNEPTAPLDRLRRDVRAIAGDLGREEVSGLVDLYYRLQEHRIALGNQSTALAKAEPPRPTALLDHFHAQLATLERQVTSALEVWTDADPSAAWAKSQVGIGPILAAGCCAYIDVEKARTAGAVWGFFGQDPTAVWERGGRRPWCAEAKVLAWKVGDSFVKSSGREAAFYGRIYQERKKYEVERDERGGNAETARRTLEDRKIKDPETRRVYESGHLPKGRLDLRARRYATKLFLAHLHEVMFEEHFGEPVPKPYPIAHLGHVGRIDPPGKP